MIHLRVVTPERTMLDEQVESVTLPTDMGEITILPNHIPLVSNLRAGEIKFKKNNSENFLATSSGVIEIKPNNLIVILAETAEFGHEIDPTRAEKARDQALKLLAEVQKDEKVFADAAAHLEKQLARLKVAHKHRTRTHRNLESGILNE